MTLKYYVYIYKITFHIIKHILMKNWRGDYKWMIYKNYNFSDLYYNWICLLYEIYTARIYIYMFTKKKIKILSLLHIICFYLSAFIFDNNKFKLFLINLINIIWSSLKSILLNLFKIIIIIIINLLTKYKTDCKHRFYNLNHPVFKYLIINQTARSNNNRRKLIQ